MIHACSFVQARWRTSLLLYVCMSGCAGTCLHNNQIVEQSEKRDTAVEERTIKVCYIYSVFRFAADVGLESARIELKLWVRIVPTGRYPRSQLRLRIALESYAGFLQASHGSRRLSKRPFTLPPRRFHQATGATKNARHPSLLAFEPLVGCTQHRLQA